MVQIYVGYIIMQVYMMTWIERKMAAALFAVPPTATVDEALLYFMEVYVVLCFITVITALHSAILTLHYKLFFSAHHFQLLLASTVAPCGAEAPLFHLFPFTSSSFPLFTFPVFSLALPIFFFCPSLPFLPE